MEQQPKRPWRVNGAGRRLCFGEAIADGKGLGFLLGQAVELCRKFLHIHDACFLGFQLAPST